jgi:uncharacterized protein with FMN-binding domain
MKRAGWYVIAGAVAGFAGVLGLGSRAATPSLVVGPKPASSRAAAAGAHHGRTARSAPATGPVQQVSGVLEQYGYGELSVAVTVRGTQIINVTVPVLRTADPQSQQIARQALPMLRSEVLAAHSARINAVSGATYTSQAYADSIQSALDKLHIK